MMNRRNLAKGAAWMAPAIAIAASAPSLAASSTNSPRVTGYADKCPGKSDVPRDFPKHGYRVVVTVLPTPNVVTVAAVTLNNHKAATILTQPVVAEYAWEWEFIVDADSSPASMMIDLIIDGETAQVSVKTFPHCR